MPGVNAFIACGSMVLPILSYLDFALYERKIEI
jgi:hypothetical protein